MTVTIFYNLYFFAQNAFDAGIERVLREKLPHLAAFLALGHAFALLAMLALLQRVTSALGQPDEVAEKWTAELSNALVTAPDDAALLLQHDRDDRSSSRGLSTTGQAGATWLGASPLPA